MKGEMEVTVKNADEFTGDKTVSWEVNANDEYMISITIFQNKVRRLDANHDIENAVSKIGVINFEKNFYWNYTNPSSSTSIPYNTEGNYKHFAGFLDFDYELMD